MAQVKGDKHLDCDTSFVRDEIPAGKLPHVAVNHNGELILLDAFDLAVAEHRMVHCVANRELGSGSNSRGWFDRLRVDG
jgi:hypothetical protein